MATSSAKQPPSVLRVRLPRRTETSSPRSWTSPLSDSEMDDLAKKLEGYQVAGQNPPTSTGRTDIVIQKSGENGGYSRRRITARREKKGWERPRCQPWSRRFPGMGGRRTTGRNR